MGRIVCQIAIENITNGRERLELSALVDTGASLLTLPKAWKEKLGDLQTIGDVELETAAQTTISGEICGPVKIQIEGFRPVFGEVLFIEMEPEDGIYEPLVGYIVLESSQASVDMIGHRLVPVKHLDLK
jgi:predicted aspartyl protease